MGNPDDVVRGRSGLQALKVRPDDRLDQGADGFGMGLDDVRRQSAESNAEAVLRADLLDGVLGNPTMIEEIFQQDFAIKAPPTMRVVSASIRLPLVALLRRATGTENVCFSG